MSIAKNFVVKVVGLTFVESYPDNIRQLNEIAEDSGIVNGEEGTALPVFLIRNPDNQHDANAIEVHVPALEDNSLVGHVPAGVAAKLAPSIDAGDAWAAEVDSVNIHPEHPDNPGIGLRIFRLGEARHSEPF